MFLRFDTRQSARSIPYSAPILKQQDLPVIAKTTQLRQYRKPSHSLPMQMSLQTVMRAKYTGCKSCGS